MKKINIIFLLIAAGVAIGVSAFVIYFYGQAVQPTIRIGILNSLSGTLAVNELTIVDATRLAIEEINEQGGVLGRLLEPIFFDGKSNDDIFAQGAEHLITQEQVAVIFGLWSSSTRKTVLPVIEKYNHLLIYPTSYEGIEQSPNIIYTGGTPNSKFMPSIVWSMKHLGKRFFVIGSEYIAPRAETELIRDIVTSRGGEIVGEEFVPVGSTNILHLVDKIIEAKPDVIIDIVGGEAAVFFYKELLARGITPDKIPAMTFNVTETELDHLGYSTMIGDYSPANYFQSIDTPRNKEFVKAFKKKYGKNRVIGSAMESAYYSVYLWKDAVEAGRSYAIADVIKNIQNRIVFAPEGRIYTDYENHHTWRYIRIGKIRSDGQFDIVWQSPRPVRPLPYPPYRTREKWDEYVQSMYTKWGNRWGIMAKK